MPFGGKAGRLVVLCAAMVQAARGENSEYVGCEDEDGVREDYCYCTVLHTRAKCL